MSHFPKLKFNFLQNVGCCWRGIMAEKTGTISLVNVCNEIKVSLSCYSHIYMWTGQRHEERI